MVVVALLGGDVLGVDSFFGGEVFMLFGEWR